LPYGTFLFFKNCFAPDQRTIFRENNAQNPRKADALGGFLKQLSRKRVAERAALPCGVHPFGGAFFVRSAQGRGERRHWLGLCQKRNGAANESVGNEKKPMVYVA
jgi:hypothetical protein